jgi:hypothetical protein
LPWIWVRLSTLCLPPLSRAMYKPIWILEQTQ